MKIHDKKSKEITLMQEQIDERSKRLKIIEELKNKNILLEIKKELDKEHLEDDNLKMTTFFTVTTAFLKEPKKRMSIALIGDSSTGKDNLIRTVLKHIPNKDYLFLTGATQPALEDEAVYTKILALSEMNLFREFGANKNLLEVVKQRTEGGTSALKKDVTDGFKTTKHEKTEQGTVIYGTTDSERNPETETRFIFGNVGTSINKINKVNSDTALKLSEPDLLIKLEDNSDSWIKKMMSFLVQEYGDCLISIPYAPILTENKFVDCNNPRSMRDFKRLLSLTASVTFLNALKRTTLKYRGYKILFSEPQDLINTLKYSKEFFNQTYSGMDERLNNVLDLLNEREWTARDKLQIELRVSINTIKSYCTALEELGLVEWKQGSDLNYFTEIKCYDGNKKYYKRCQEGIKKALISCQENELKEKLDKFKLIPFIKERCQNKGVNLVKNECDTFKNPDFDTFPLTPLNKDELEIDDFFKSNILKVGGSE